MNLGYMVVEVSTDAGTITCVAYYDSTASVSGPQPLINGPRGYCLDISNSGPTRKLKFTYPDGITVREAMIGSGDPVKSRSLTVNQMNNLGFINRSDVTGFSIE